MPTIGSPIGPSIKHCVSFRTAKPTKRDRADTEIGRYQIVAEKAFVTRESFAKPCEAVCAAKGCKAPFSISLTDLFLLHNAVCPFADWLRYQHELNQSAVVHLRNQHVRNRVY